MIHATQLQMYTVRLTRVLFALLMLAVLATPALTQIKVPLKTGDQLRVQMSTGERAAGWLVGMEDERLQLETRLGFREFSLPDVQHLEVSIGRKHFEGALIGAGIGLLGGYVFGVAIAKSDRSGGGANMAMIGLPLFTIPAGAVLGALVAPHRYVGVARPYRIETFPDVQDAIACCR